MLWTNLSGMEGRKYLLAALAVLLRCAPISAEGQKLNVKHENDVFVLDAETFHHLVQANEIVLILFHVPWDARYKQMLPDYEKAAKILEAEAPSVSLARIDMCLHPEIPELIDVRGDSSQFILFHHSKPYNFDDFTNTQELVKKLKDMSQMMWSPARPHPELVDELTQHDFEGTIKGLDVASVLFYRDNCPMCVRLMLEYETALVNMTELGNVGKGARFFKVNLDQAADVASKYEIYEVPTLKIFRNGKAYNFKSKEKTVSGILEYLKRQLEPAYKTFQKLEEAEGWGRSYPNKAAVIGQFDDTKNPALPVFQEVANHFRDDINFALVKGPLKSRDALDFSPLDTDTGEAGFRVVVNPPRRHVSMEDKHSYLFPDSSPTVAKLSEYVSKMSLPKVGQRTLKNANTTYAKRPLLIGYLKVDWGKGEAGDDTVFHRNKMAQVVRGFPDITWCISDRREFKSELARFGFSQNTEELLVGIVGKNGEYYQGPVAEMMNLKHLTDFAEDYRKNRIKPYHRTQSPPTSDDSDDYPVKVVVGATFRKFVLRHDKQVVLLAHRPQCPACRKALTVFNEIAEEKKYPGLVFASMDTFGNDAPARFVPKTYPTLFMVPFDKRAQPISFPSRSFTKEKIVEFLDAHYQRYRPKDEL